MRDAYLDRIREVGGVVGAGLHAGINTGVVSGHREFDCYVDTATRDTIVSTFRARPLAGGNLTLRTVDEPHALPLLRATGAIPPAAVAVDLIEDPDERTYRAGYALLEQIRST